ncbi:hypothetical protein [Brevundimonas pondensis]|uniref:Uncharacterized protein n=1 Tax=Brevundimonas pondensis TaxID=2774189 RepID=A0ABX7SN44_9CAUL|nr:hypothetical protein [Brevundimonas pondensis]QTC88205.1 hypothetical protein IFE19_02005 [Brevundimonas pondensis]
MSDEPGSPSPSEKAFANDLPQLEQELADRAEPTRSDAQVRAVVAGLLAGMTHVGRPSR